MAAVQDGILGPCPVVLPHDSEDEVTGWRSRHNMLANALLCLGGTTP